MTLYLRQCWVLGLVTSGFLLQEVDIMRAQELGWEGDSQKVEGKRAGNTQSMDRQSAVLKSRC